MDTGKQSGEAGPRSPDIDARPVVLVLVENTVGSLASLLLAAEIAAVQRARLHVAHVSAPRMWWGAAAGMPAPAALLAEADRAAADELRTRSLVHDTVTRLVSELSPIAVVVGAPRGPRLFKHLSMARWLIGQHNVRAVVVG